MITYRQPFRGEYPITQKYGEYIAGVTVGEKHTGIDYACPVGTPILASAGGVVIAAGWDLTGYGFRVILKHADGRATLYAHLDSIDVNAGESVLQGQVIGYSGWSGNVVPQGPEGAHLHFEARRVWSDYTSHIDPMTLPLMSVDDSVADSASSKQTKLKGAEAFKAGDVLRVQNLLGVKAFHDTGFSYSRVSMYNQGTPVYFTGDTVVRKDNGLTYMRVVPALFSVWIAVNDGETQLLDKE